MLYHLLLEGDLFHRRIRPALAVSWRQRSFAPCQELCTALTPAAQAFAERYHINPEEQLLSRVASGLPFDRAFWRFLVGEILWVSAVEIPEMQTTPDALCCLVAPERYREADRIRERFVPIEQTFYGARALTFGSAFYRPEHVGYNDSDDVARLGEYLASLDPQQWTPARLASLPGLADDEERAEELAFVREWFPALCDLYRRAAQQNQIIVCEILEPGRDS